MAFNDVITRTEAGPLIPEAVTQEVFANVTRQSAFLSLARRLPDFARGQVRMPVLNSLIAAGFVSPTDTGLKITSGSDWTNKYITAEEIAVVIPVPQSVVDDMDYDIWEQLRPQIEEAFGAVIDGATFAGTGKPASWPDGIAVAAAAAGNTVSLAAAADVYEAVMDEGGVIGLVEEDGYLVNGHVAAVQMRAKLRGLRTSDGIPIFQSSMQTTGQFTLDGSAITFPMNGTMDPATNLMISGDWRQAVWALRQDLTTKILDQAVITDGSGVIQFNLAQQDMVALRVVMRLGWQIPNPPNRQNSNAATRYPFARLAP